MPATTRIHWLVPMVLGPPVAAAVALAWLRPADASWALAGGLALLLAVGFAWARAVGSRRQEWVVAGCAFALVLWPELALRVAGLRYDEAGTIFGIWAPIAARDDADFFWTLPPERPEVNREGFPGPDFVIPKPAGTWRMLFFGDSCTQQGYPGLVADRLAADLPQRRFEAVNLGVAGYSSLQGRLVADAWLERLQPDLSVVFFGWNDRWRAFGMSDAERARPAQSPAAARGARLAPAPDAHAPAHARAALAAGVAARLRPGVPRESRAHRGARHARGRADPAADRTELPRVERLPRGAPPREARDERRGGES